MTERTPASVDELLARVTELEIRVAYQEDLLEKLDGVVREFSDRSLRNERRIGELEVRLRQAETAAAPQVGPADEEPPHY